MKLHSSKYNSNPTLDNLLNLFHRKGQPFQSTSNNLSEPNNSRLQNPYQQSPTYTSQNRSSNRYCSWQASQLTGRGAIPFIYFGRINRDVSPCHSASRAFGTRARRGSRTSQAPRSTGTLLFHYQFGSVNCQRS